MHKLLTLFSLFYVSSTIAQALQKPVSDRYVLVIHGGAGTIEKSKMTPEREVAYHRSLGEALLKGQEILKNGGTALDAVEATVRVLEDNPLFNAGKGAVFTNEGKNELDASIMNGKTLAAGSVAGVTTIKNPISAARAVMESSPHVMMAGRGAEAFAQLRGLEIVDPSYFYTEDRYRSLQSAKKGDSLLLEFDSVNRSLEESKRKMDSVLKDKNPKEFNRYIDSLKNEIQKEAGKKKQIALHLDMIYGSELLMEHERNNEKYGTVGAVALDRYGNLAAATSTGGMTNKRFGRIGDAPIIGAGTYANNKTCAISGTGWGEFYIRLVLAKSVSDLMEYKNLSLKAAADEMVMKQLPKLGGDGGLVAVDKNGNIAMPFCTSGMYRGYVKSDGKIFTAIYK